jgi:hypothetical protein
MRRGEAAGLLRDALALDALVITSLGTAGRAWRESDPPQLSYPASDPMGRSGPCCSSRVTASGP